MSFKLQRRIRFACAGMALWLPLCALSGCKAPSHSAQAEGLFTTAEDGSVVGEIEFTGLPATLTLPDTAEWTDAIQIFCLDDEGVPGPPLITHHQLKAGRVRIVPAFPLLAGKSYQLTLDPSRIPDIDGVISPITVVHRVPAATMAEAPSVDAIYPSANVLPANHLKFYIVFSEPMQQGEIFSNFSLTDVTTNKPVPRPFRHTELWSEDNRRLTLWFHPGRQKTGVNLNVELGAILMDGHRYRLTIDGNWVSRRGTPLGKSVNKEFSAGPADHKQPNIQDWKVEVPAAGTRAPLRVVFDEPLDWALAHKSLSIHSRDTNDPQASHIGTASMTTSHDESGVLITPRDSWPSGDFTLHAVGLLEDLAGNSLDRPFELDIRSDDPRRPTEHLEHTLSFSIGPAADGDNPEP